MSNRFWAILFAGVLLACFLSLVIAPFVGWWMPPNVSSFGGDIDNLFYIILAATGVFFILTEVILVVAIWRFPFDPKRRAHYTEGNLLFEAIWTIVPGIILLYLAFAQIPAWSKVTYANERPVPDQVVTVYGRQWDWQLRYHDANRLPDNPRNWAENAAISDLVIPNELHIWKGAKVSIYLKTQDVLHSFFLPNFRRKQDLLPGKTMAIWIEAIDSNVIRNPEKGTWEIDPTPGKTWEIACAELCGGRHYAMRGLVYVHPDRADYEAWLKQALTKQRSYVPEAGK
jgi:cytochrome c oxidase subunit 2